MHSLNLNASGLERAMLKSEHLSLGWRNSWGVGNVYFVWFCVEEVLMEGGREEAFCTDS